MYRYHNNILQHFVLEYFAVGYTIVDPKSLLNSLESSDKCTMTRAGVTTNLKLTLSSFNCFRGE